MIGLRTSGLARLAPRHRRQLIRFLCREPERNAYLLAQVERGALTRDEIAGPMMGHWVRGELDGVAVFGSNLVLSSPASPLAIASFAEYARRARFRIWVAVGEDAGLDDLMSRFAPDRAGVRVERGGQILYRLRRGELSAEARTRDLRPARIEEVEALIRADREMVIEELGFDPFTRDLESYRDGWRRRARDGRCWVLTDRQGSILFKIDQSAASEHVVQLAGIWTLPTRRREGVALRGVGEMCHRLLEEVPLLTLYVARDNTAAVKLYERLGFEAVGTVRSVWFAL